MRFATLCVLASLLAAGAALAQNSSQAITATAVTVGTSSAQAIGAGSRRYLALLNQSATATVYCAFNTTAAVAAATAGQLTITPLGGIYLDAGGITPSNQVNCIASASGTPLTVLSQ